MKIHFTLSIFNQLVLLISISVFSLNTNAQSQNLKETNTVINDVNKYIEQFRAREALSLIEPYFKTKTKNNNFPKNDYINLCLKYIEVLELADQNSDVIIEFNRLKEKYVLSDSTFVDLHLILARMYEKVEDEVRTKNNLLIAKSYVTKETSQNSLLNWNIRMASYHRVFADKDSALIYAKRALKFDGNEKGSAYFLISFLEKDFKLRVENLEVATQIYKKKKDDKALAFMYINFYNLYAKKGFEKIGKKYIDSSGAIAKTLDQNDLKEYYFESLSSYHENARNLDSAIYYRKQAYSWAIKNVNQRSSDKIYYVNRKFQNEKLQDSLKVIKTELNSKNQISKLYRRKNEYKNFLIITIILFLIAALIFLFYQLKNKRKIEKDAKIIHKTNEKLLKTIEYNSVLEKELQHRVKNNLALILSVISFQIDEIDDKFFKSKFITLKNRISAVALVHERYLNKSSENLSSNQSVNDSINEIVHSLIDIQKHQISFKCEIEHLFFPIEFMMPLGILINELVSNTLKHAETTGKKEIFLKIIKIEKEVLITYSDNGHYFASTSNQEERLGMFIIKSMIIQLNGNYERENSTYSIAINIEQADD